METKSKLAFLELISGLVGWVWIGASIAALYFFAMAVFSDGAWHQFFWAVGVGLVAKWLAKGFGDSKARVAIEADLVEKGYSAKEAGRTWLQEYSGASQSQTEPTDAKEIIQAYGEILETSAPIPGCVADESKLPYPKIKIKEAIIAGLRSTEDTKMKEQLKISYVLLAGWQAGVGESDQGLDLSNIDTNQDAKFLAKAVLEQTSGSGNWAAIAQK